MGFWWEKDGMRNGGRGVRIDVSRVAEGQNATAVTAAKRNAVTAAKRNRGEDGKTKRKEQRCQKRDLAARRSFRA